ncbi:MAG: insulinase family protein, partial [Candidatus Kapabacteria bacterium]|nr:insulinase family protein [Candidatus Kapabacteria bacterium]
MLSLTQQRLSNGCEVLVVRLSRVPVVALVVLYRVGSQDEAPHQAGLAHLVEHLAFGTSAYLAREEFDLYCTDAGGTNNAMTTYSYTIYTMVLPQYQLPLGLWLEGSRMRALNFTEQEFITQQHVILEELQETVYNQPYARWRDIQAQNAFAPHCPYHWTVHGSLQTVAALTVQDAREFSRRYYRPDNAVVSICGDVDPAYALELSERFLGNIPSESGLLVRRDFSPECRRGDVVAVLPDAVPLSAVFLSFHCGGYVAPEFLQVQALADILGGGRSSRLYRALLLRQGLASDVGAFLDA